MKDLKLYDVTVGMHDAGGDNHNMSGFTILATDVEAAIQKARKHRKLEKGEYIEECKLVSNVNFA